MHEATGLTHIMCVLTGNYTCNLHPTFITSVAYQYLRSVGSCTKSRLSEARMWPLVAQATTDHRSTYLILDKGEISPDYESGSALNSAVAG